MTPNIVALAPIPSANVNITTNAKAGWRASARDA
jgi:hypothetical protein